MKSPEILKDRMTERWNSLGRANLLSYPPSLTFRAFSERAKISKMERWNLKRWNDGWKMTPNAKRQNDEILKERTAKS